MGRWLLTGVSVSSGSVGDRGDRGLRDRKQESTGASPRWVPFFCTKQTSGGTRLGHCKCHTGTDLYTGHVTQALTCSLHISFKMH